MIQIHIKNYYFLWHSHRKELNKGLNPLNKTPFLIISTSCCNKVLITKDSLKSLSVLMKSLNTYTLISKALKSVLFYSMINLKMYKLALLKRVSSNWILPNFKSKTTKYVSVIVTNTIMMAVAVLVLLMLTPNSIFTLNLSLILPIEFFLFSINPISKLKWSSM